MVAEHLRAVKPLGQVMEIPAQRIWHGLRLVVVVEAGEVAPAAIAAHLDQPRAELDPKEEPSEQHDEREERCHARGAEEDREEPGLAQERFPAERVEGLADVHDREIERPERRPPRHRERERKKVGRADDRARGKGEPGPRDREKDSIGVTDVEEARRATERDRTNEIGNGEQPVLAEEGTELVDRDQERDEIDRGERTLKDEAGQPVVRCAEPVHRRG